MRNQWLSPEQTTPVGNYPPNQFGLQDMHGNLWEWNYDLYEKEQDKSNSGLIDLRNKKNINELLSSQKREVYAAVRGLSIRGIAVVRLETGTILSTATSTTAFGLCVVSPGPNSFSLFRDFFIFSIGK